MAEDQQLLVRLLAALIVKDTPTIEGAGRLARLGVSTSDIALVFGTTDATIRTAISRFRKREKGTTHE